MSIQIASSPIGPLVIESGPAGVRRIHPAEPAATATGPFPDVGATIDLGEMGEFGRAVLAATRAIPPGQTRTYAQIAVAIGRPGAVRAVGSALRRNPVPILVPCHRVVRSDGDPGEYALGRDAKLALLAAEAAAA